MDLKSSFMVLPDYRNRHDGLADGSGNRRLSPMAYVGQSTLRI